MSVDARWTRAVVALSLVSSVSLLGCGAGADRTRRDLETMQRESTPERLEAQGDGYAAVGDVTRAEQYFVAALRAGGDAGLLTRKLVAVCAADNRYPAGLEYAEDYLRKRPADVDVRFAAATLRLALGDTEGAREKLRGVVAVQPDFADAHFALAQLDKEQGDPMAADAHFREYLRVAPSGKNAETARANLMRAVP